MCELITVLCFYDQVGLMRDGVLLTQSSPTALLKAYNTTVSQDGSQLAGYIVKQPSCNSTETYCFLHRHWRRCF